MSTTTYTPLTITSFPSKPLTTAFSRPPTCGGIYVQPPGDILVVDQRSTTIDSTCYPPGFATQERSFFSPGIACPSGYWTACTGTGVSTITTVTCCPVINTISMLCIDPAQLSAVWQNQFCTWIAPPKGDTVTVTKSENGRTSTVVTSLNPPGGLNAYGIRMVFQASDMPTTSTSSQTSSTAPAGQSTGGPGQNPEQVDKGLSTGGTIAIAIAIPILIIAAAVGFFFWRRSRKERTLQNQQNHHLEQPVAVVSGMSPSPSHKPQNVYYGYAPVPGPVPYQAAGEAGVPPAYNQQVHAELPGAHQGNPTELPTSGQTYELR
ncbi:hypothetical protein QBC43DRAFT_9672 [Cladorrhinum sp. PSN259]|nr:hypothetical protein QBC43DRAFT_9672 [Cladorrhinum sp. PSN259]